MTKPGAMTVANDDTIIRMIRNAKRRLVVMAPGLTQPIAVALGEQWRALGSDAVTVILDVDPEVCRLGYGEIGAIKHLEPLAAGLGAMVNHHAGVRVGLIIADDATLIYAPTPLLVEASPHADTAPAAVKPNAICMSLPPADVERDLGLGADGTTARTIGLDKADKATLKRLEDDLAENPPQRFDISRCVRVFNAQFEFVEIEVKGALLQRKTVRIPNDLLGIGEDGPLDDAMRMTLRVIDGTSPLSGEFLQRWRGLIIKRYLKHIPSHGFVLLRKDKPRFERSIRLLQSAVDRFRERVRDGLNKELDAKRRSLIQLLVPYLQSSRQSERIKLALQRTTPEAIVDAALRPAFLDAARWANEISMRVAYKGVTYESLNDPGFMAAVRACVPDTTTLFEEFDAARAAPPSSTPPMPMKGAA